MSCEYNKSKKCPCTSSCARHGKCCECVAYHQPKGGFPACFFSKEAEVDYDRGYERLIKDRSK